MSENVLLYSPSGSGGSNCLELIEEKPFTGDQGFNAKTTIVDTTYDTEKYIGVIVDVDLKFTASSGNNKGNCYITGDVNATAYNTGVNATTAGSCSGRGGSFDGSVFVEFNANLSAGRYYTSGTYKMYGIIGTIE